MTPENVKKATALLYRRDQLGEHVNKIAARQSFDIRNLEAQIEGALGERNGGSFYDMKKAWLSEVAKQEMAILDAKLRDLGVGAEPVSKTFEVDLVTTATVLVKVEATSEEEAREKAADIARGSDEWTINDELVEIRGVN